MTTTRSVQNFFEELGHPRHLFRYIRVQRDEEGKKNPIGEKNNMTEAEVRDKASACAQPTTVQTIHRADGRARAVAWASCCVGCYHLGFTGPSASD